MILEYKTSWQIESLQFYTFGLIKYVVFLGFKHNYG